MPARCHLRPHVSLGKWGVTSLAKAPEIAPIGGEQGPNVSDQNEVIFSRFPAHFGTIEPQ